MKLTRTKELLLLPPAVEPVSVAEALAYLQVTHHKDDHFIGSLITAARQLLEEVCTVELPDADLAILLGPLLVEDVPAAAAAAKRGPRQFPIRLRLPPGLPDRAGAHERVGDVGRGPVPLRPPAIPANLADHPRLPRRRHAPGHQRLRRIAEDVPRPLRQAILMLVRDWYDVRGNILVDGTIAKLPNAVDQLIAPYRFREPSP